MTTIFHIRQPHMTDKPTREDKDQFFQQLWWDERIERMVQHIGSYLENIVEPQQAIRIASLKRKKGGVEVFNRTTVIVAAIDFWYDAIMKGTKLAEEDLRRWMHVYLDLSDLGAGTLQSIYVKRETDARLESIMTYLANQKFQVRRLQARRNINKRLIVTLAIIRMDEWITETYPAL